MEDNNEQVSTCQEVVICIKVSYLKIMVVIWSVDWSTRRQIEALKNQKKNLMNLLS